MKYKYILIVLIMVKQLKAQQFNTVFETSKGLKTSTYFDVIDYYNKLNVAFNTITIKNFGLTDAGYPLQVVLYNYDANFNSDLWKKEKKVVIFINNGIHPGEPDGIDASMMFLRDVAQSKIKVPKNIVLAAIPVYNIGGCLNRNSTTRVNQNGPSEHGFRGNSQNLDLNRDFTKCDSKEAKEFIKIYQWLQPDIFIDNHVSDGADYQHTMTMLTTQHSKLGGNVGSFLNEIFEPFLFSEMKNENWEMCPYVNFEDSNPDKGWAAFYDAPRYSSGYAAMFSTMAFVPETHMLKPFKERVYSTYAFMKTMVKAAEKHSHLIKQNKAADELAKKNQSQFALGFKVDSSRFELRNFNGYDTSIKISKVTQQPQYYYNHDKPFSKQVKFYNYFVPTIMVAKPKAYIIPQGWHEVIDLLKINGVVMKSLDKDTLIEVEACKIDDYKTPMRAYEKHYRHNATKVKTIMKQHRFLKGDKIIYTGTTHDRFLIEMLEPIGEDSYFAWNFFDAILQQKEGYSNYRWEAVAEQELNNNPSLKQLFEQKRKTDAKFAASVDAQLDFIYKNSKWYEDAHLLYPVFRLK